MGQKPRVVRIVVTVVLVAAGVWVCVRVAQKPVISVDYLKKFNEMRKPADYRAEDDGGELYMRACMALDNQGYPEIKRDEERVTWPGDMTPEELQVVKGWAADPNGVLAMASEALAKKYWYVERSSKDGTMMNVWMAELAGTRNLCYDLTWRGKMKALAGDVEGGIDDVMMSAEIGRMLSERPCLLLEYRVAIAAADSANKSALEIASRCTMSSKELGRLAARVERAGERYQSLNNGLEGERLRFYDAVQRCFSDDGHGNGRPLALAMGSDKSFWRYYLGETRFPNSLWETLFRYGWALKIADGSESRKATLARYDGIIRKIQEIDAEQPWQFRARGGDWWPWLKKEEHADEFIGLFVPVSGKAAFSGHAHRARVEGTVATIAALRYKAEKGTFPVSLEEVVDAGYLKEVPIDRFSGKSLVYKKTGDGFTVYSVGEDWMDDGGDRRKDIVVWPPEVVNRQPTVESRSNEARE